MAPCGEVSRGWRDTQRRNGLLPSVGNKTCHTIGPPYGSSLAGKWVPGYPPGWRQASREPAERGSRGWAGPGPAWEPLAAEPGPPHPGWQVNYLLVLCLALTWNRVARTLIASLESKGAGMAVQWRTRRSLGALAASLVTAGLVVAPGAAAAPTASCQVWTGVPPPSPGAVDNDLFAVTAPGPCNVWAVGFYRDVADGQALSLAEHWNGTAWAVVPTPSPDADLNFLSAVSEASLGDMWAVGD